MQQLHQRFLATEPICLRCHGDIESVLHCLVSFPESKEVWSNSSSSMVSQMHQLNNFHDWWLEQKTRFRGQQHGDKQILLLAVQCWNIWRAKNAWIFDKVKKPWIDILEASEKMVQEVQKVRRL
ncbi:hypothetical protein HN51_059797 [Arachis hypogaea]